MFTIVGLALWGFAGFDRLPAWEGWRIFDGFARGAHGWWLTPDTGGFAGNSLRPLEVLPHQVGYALSADSFIGFNIVSMAAFIVRGTAAYGLVRELLPGCRPVALGASLVFALSPAADGLMLDRTIHVQWATALAIASLAVLLVAIRRDQRRFAVIAAALMPASLLMYEAALPVALIAPAFFVLWATKRRVAVKMCCIYGIGIALALGYSLWTRLGANSSYQASIATTQRPMFDHDGVAAIVSALKWELGGSIKRTLLNDLPMQRPDISAHTMMVAVAIAALCAVVLGFIATGEWRGGASGRSLIGVAFLGTVWLVASLAIFLPFTPYRQETLRAHSVAQFGAVLIAAVVVRWVIDRIQAWGVVLLTIGVLLVALVAVQNAAMWKHWSDFQSQMISALDIQSRQSTAQTVVIRDNTDRLSHIYESGPSALYLGVAADLAASAHKRDLIVCNTSGVTAVGFAQMGPCTWTADELVVKPLPGYPDADYRVQRSAILDLTLHAGDQIQLRPTDGALSATPVAVRWDRLQRFLPCVLGEACADSAVQFDLPTAPFRADFVRQYSYEDVPTRGIPVEDFGPIQKNGPSWRWTTSPDAAVFGQLEQGRYEIRAHVLSSAVSGGEDQATISLNGLRLETRRESDDAGGVTLIAIGSVGAQSPTADRIGIFGPVSAQSGDGSPGVGLAIEWIAVRIVPAG
ncbi:MAG: hypothetical protein ACOH17_08300 [Cellulomonas sp.]